jgi:transcriptional regulator with XRE-family HTH domain
MARSGTTGARKAPATAAAKTTPNGVRARSASAKVGASARRARPPDAIEIATDEMLRMIGAKFRRVRQERQLTLETVASRTGLTGAMVSMVELGRVAPSFGTLVAIASALNIHMSDLFDTPERNVREPVTRLSEQATLETGLGVLRRQIQVDHARGLEFVINEYAPGTCNSNTVVHHAGHEYGLLLEGRLTIELGEESYHLRPGDSVTYSSTTPHRIVNNARTTARAAWVKLGSDRQPDSGRM